MGMPPALPLLLTLQTTPTLPSFKCPPRTGCPLLPRAGPNIKHLLGPMVFRIMPLFKLQVVATRVVPPNLALALTENTILEAVRLECITPRILIDRVMENLLNLLTCLVHRR